MKIIVNAHKCEIDKTPVNEKEINITKCEFEFAEEITSEFVKEAYFTLGKGETYKQIIVNNECDIPGEVLKKKGDVTIGVVAYLVENENIIKRYNPRPAYFNTWEGSLRDAENSQPITPSEMEQYEQALQDGLSEVNQKLVDIDEAIEDVNEAITETNNLNLDVSKSGKVATVTLTKKDASTKAVTLSDGTSLMFNWDGTKLGIKTDEDAEYTYVDLQGIQGVPGPKGDAFQIKKTYTSVAEMNADFNNMQLGDYVMIATTVEVEDNAKLYTRGEEQWIFISDFSGATGIRGETGLTPNIQIGTVVSGETPNVTRTGTNENPILNFTLVKGDKGDVGSTGPTGATGNGIASITKTSTEGLVDTYTITYTNGTTSTFQVTNGEDGETPLSDFNALKADVEDLRDNQIILSEQGINIHVEDAAKARLYEFGLSKESSQETTRGVQLFDKDNANIIYGFIANNNDIFNYSNNNSKSLYISCNPNTTYTVSKVASYRLRVASSIVLPARNVDITKYFYSNDSASKATVTTDENANYLIVTYYNSENDTLTEQQILDSIQIEEGSTATPWGKYTGGQPSPNPNYPQEVKTVKGYRNLFDKDNLVIVQNRIYNDSGQLVYAGSSGTTQMYVVVKPNTTYTISGFLKTNDNQRIISFDANKNFLNRNIIFSNVNYYTFITGNNTYFIDVQYILSGTDFNNYQIVEGTQEFSYVPYGSNYVNVKVTGKNWFNQEWESGNINVTTGNNENANDRIRTIGYIPVTPNIAYYISRTIATSNNTYRFYDENYNYLGYNGTANMMSGGNLTANTYNGTFTILNSNVKYMRIADVTTDTSTKYLLQFASIEDKTYEPYQEANVPIPLNNNEIAGIGNYLDELIVDKDGKVWLNKKLPIMILNGNENWTMKANDGTNYCYSVSISENYLYSSEFSGLSKYFKVGNAAGYRNALNKGVGIYFYYSTSDTNKILYLVTTISTVNELKEWLSTHNTEVYYVLVTSQPIDLNTTVDLRLFKGVNNITNSEDGNMRIRYVESIESIINDFDTRLKALEQGESL